MLLYLLFYHYIIGLSKTNGLKHDELNIHKLGMSLRCLFRDNIRDEMSTFHTLYLSNVLNEFQCLNSRSRSRKTGGSNTRIKALIKIDRRTSTFYERQKRSRNIYDKEHGPCLKKG